MQHLAPPTPAVALADLLAHPELGLRQVAGPREDTLLHWVHASEMENPVPYLLGGELLLTAGVHFPSAHGLGAHLDRYVARTVDAGAAALGFGLAPLHDETPGALIEACDRHGLPLVEVPPQTPFAAVARAVWQAMAEARHRELRRVTEAQQALAAAAARPDPVPAVLRQLAHHLGSWAVLLAPGGEELYAAGPIRTPETVAAAARLADVVRPGGTPRGEGSGSRRGPVTAGRRGTPSSATDNVGDTRLAAYALAGGAEGEQPVLVLALPAARRDPADHTLAGVAAVLLSLLTGPYRGAAEAGRSSALVRLLLGARPEDVAPLLAGPAPGAGGEDAPRWVVVHGRRRGSGTGPGPAAAPLEAAALAAALGTALVDMEGDAVRALLPADRRIGDQPGWTLGVSGPVAAGELAAADAQAAGALRRALAKRSALARHRSGDEGVSRLVAPREARAHARERLGPLLDSPVLMETLRTWLGLHGSWDRTAVALQVHRNTVRQRITRAAALLDADLDDPDTRMELWFALRWC